MNLQFKREHRYFVFKVKNLTQEQQQRLFDFEMELGPRNSVGECVVVESDWPNYQETWDSIRDVSCGTFKPREVLVAERNALAKEVDEANDRIGELTEERGAMAAQLVDAFGDGYYDGFLDGAKHHEAEDCSTDPAYLGEDALRCSEIAESEKASHIGISKKQQCLRDVKAEAGRAGFVAGFNDSGEGFNGEYGASDKSISELADEYAATVRQGGE